MAKFARTATVIAAVTMVISLSACSSGNTVGSTGSENAPNGALAWSFPTQDVSIWNAQLKLMEPMVSEAGYELLTDSPNFNVTTQVSDWESWVARGDVKAIGGFPADASSMTAVTAQAASAGIPVIGYAGKWDGVDHAVLISNYDAGMQVGQAAGEWINQTYGGQSVRVATMSDTTAQLGQDQLAGLKAGLAASGAKAEISQLEAKTRNDGYSQAQSQLVAHPDTVVWLGIGSDMVLGARQALIDSGVPANDPKHYVSATDADSEALDLIASGNDMWRTSFAWNAQDLAEANVKQLLAAANGSLSGDIEVGVAQVTKDNVDDFRNN
ncbi:substrate-binding domain-containing protein [Brooklawnia sp.]|uniref:sugar ABC transporter substrate-binding protein n=1 Tax=Brooklawnia sp. TaxID=2699740 RepID=UPI00311E66A7